MLFEARQFQAASKALDDAVRLEPGETIDDQDMRAQLALAAGQNAQVITLCGGAGDWEQRELLAIADYALGNRAEAERQFSVLRTELADSGAVQYAEIFAQWGQHAEALRWLHAAMAARDPGLVGIGIDRLLDPLRAEPEFQHLAQTLGM